MFSADIRAYSSATIILPPEHNNKETLEHDEHISRHYCDPSALPQGDWFDWLLTKDNLSATVDTNQFDFDQLTPCTATGDTLVFASATTTTTTHNYPMAVTHSQQSLSGIKRTWEQTQSTTYPITYPSDPSDQHQQPSPNQIHAESNSSDSSTQSTPRSSPLASPVRSPISGAGALEPPRKRRVTRKRKNVAVKVDKLLMPLCKQQLLDLLLKLTQDPSVEETVRQNAPAFNVSESIAKLRRLSAALYKSFPHTRYGSSYDHYTYLRVADQEAAFVKAAKKPLKMLVQSRQWIAALDYIEAAMAEAAELPNWDCADDCKTKRALFRSFALSLLKVVRGLDDMDVAQERWLRLRDICVAQHNVNTGMHFENCIRDVNARIIPRAV